MAQMALSLVSPANRLPADLVGAAKVWLHGLDGTLMGKKNDAPAVLAAVDRFNRGDFRHSPFERKAFPEMELRLVTVEMGLAWRVGLLVRSLDSDEAPALFFGPQRFRFSALKFRDLATQVSSEKGAKFQLVTSLEDPRLIVDARVEGEDYTGTSYVATRSLVVPEVVQPDHVGKMAEPVRRDFYASVAPAAFLEAQLSVASITPTDLLGIGSHLVVAETLPGLAAAAMATGYHYVRAELIKTEANEPTVPLGLRLYQHYLAKLGNWAAGVREQLIQGGPQLVQLDARLTSDLLALDEILTARCDPHFFAESMLHRHSLPLELWDCLHQVATLSVFSAEV